MALATGLTDVWDWAMFKLVHGDGAPMSEWPGTSVPRRSLCPTVQPKTSPFRWAKSTARTTSPTRHVRPPPAFCNCWSVRLEQSSGPCPQSELHRNCFQAPAEHSFVRTVLDCPAHGRDLPVTRYNNLHLDLDLDLDCHPMYMCAEKQATSYWTRHNAGDSRQQAHPDFALKTSVVVVEPQTGACQPSDGQTRAAGSTMRTGWVSGFLTTCHHDVGYTSSIAIEDYTNTCVRVSDAEYLSTYLSTIWVLTYL